jgi:hypothetical protein
MLDAARYYMMQARRLSVVGDRRGKIVVVRDKLRSRNGRGVAAGERVAEAFDRGRFRDLTPNDLGVRLRTVCTGMQRATWHATRDARGSNVQRDALRHATDVQRANPAT